MALDAAASETGSHSRENWCCLLVSVPSILDLSVSSPLSQPLPNQNPTLMQYFLKPRKAPNSKHEAGQGLPLSFR